MTIPNLVIRPSAAADLPALQQIRQAAFAPIFRSFRQIVGDEIFAIALAQMDNEQARLLDGLCRAGSEHEVHVATVGGAVVGFVSFKTDAAKRTGGDPSHAPARRAYEKAGFGPAIPSVSLYKLL
jgi:hypothetical protein